MSSSLRRLLANRANARKSTGPKSAETKAKVAQNRTVHGLTGNFQVLEGEDQDRYDALVDQLIHDEQPVGIAEIELVKKMAQHTWLAERATRFQEACFIVMPRTAEQRANVEAEMAVRPELERYIRYQAHHNREYARASAELLKRRKERRQVEVGFESQTRTEVQQTQRAERHKVAIATAETKLERELFRTAQLIQAESAPVTEHIGGIAA